MTEHLYGIIIVRTYDFISLKTSFLCYYKPYLPNIYFAYSSGIHLLILNLKALRDSNHFLSLCTESYNFGPRYDTNSVPCQTEFTLLLLNQLLL